MIRCRTVLWSVLAAGLLLLPMGEAQAQDAPPGKRPYDMMRELRQMQDRLARGDLDAVTKQRALIEQITAEFEKADDEVWKDARNARSVLAFVLSGGDPKVLRGLLLRGQPTGVDTNLARGVHAFVSNRKGEALEHFANVNPLDLEPALAGQIALAQAELLARSDLGRALQKLAEARLLAPGTLIEEASLRRQISILSSQKRFADADKASEIYFRRFPNSAYAGTLKRQIARMTVDRPAVDEKSPLTLLEAAIDRMSRRDRVDMYLEISKEALQRGRRDIVNFAAGRAEQLTDAATLLRRRTQIYLQAMRVASLDADAAKDALEKLNSDDLAKDDAELIRAAQAIAGQINRVVTVTPSDKPEPEWLNELGATFGNVGRARERLATADKLLAEAASK